LRKERRDLSGGRIYGGEKRKERRDLSGGGRDIVRREK
jgi:hypothetical protein